MTDANLEHLTFEDCVSSFCEDRMLNNRSPKTIKFYKLELKYFYNWLINQQFDTNIESLNGNIIKKYLLNLGKSRSPGGIHCSFRSIKAFCNYIDDQLEPSWKNPIKKVKLSTVKLDPLPEIPLPIIQQLLNVCEGRNRLRDQSILYMLTDGGFRANELCMLDIKDLDNGQVHIRFGKGSKKRYVYIGSKTQKILQEYLDTRDNLEPDQPLFLTDDGSKRIGYYTLRQLLVRLTKRSGVPKFGLHSFRRTYALTLFRRGVSIYTISLLLGHSNIEITKRYLNVGNEDLREAILDKSPADMLT